MTCNCMPDLIETLPYRTCKYTEINIIRVQKEVLFTKLFYFSSNIFDTFRFTLISPGESEY